MNKNQKTYLLLALVLGVWGVIAYKILNTVNPSVSKVDIAISKDIFIPEKVKVRDTFSIVANYRDPFLGTVNAPKNPKKTLAIKDTKPKVPEKAIAYTGFITDKSSRQKIFFVTIDGQQHMMALNQTINEVKLISGSKGKIRVRSADRLRTIPLSE
ncbi:hypothetical protein [Maribacter sp. 2210JD10-5]|uniref:hypothetical protein n=1 Tax=Maribacter sp. 2210JD10-5 TaxID=3386272 RepID=UPI0039BC45CC